MRRKPVFRPLAPVDEPFLWDMLYQAIYVPAGQPAPPPDIVRQPALSRYVAGWGRPGDSGFLAALSGPADDGQPGHNPMPVGAAWLRLFPPFDPAYGFVSADIPELSIAVLPAWRGQGLGSRLIQAVIHQARLTFAGVSLSVSHGNPALHLYTRLGFQPVHSDACSLTMAVWF